MKNSSKANAGKNMLVESTLFTGTANTIHKLSLRLWAQISPIRPKNGEVENFGFGVRHHCQPTQEQREIVY